MVHAKHQNLYLLFGDSVLHCIDAERLLKRELALDGSIRSRVILYARAGSNISALLLALIQGYSSGRVADTCKAMRGTGASNIAAHAERNQGGGKGAWKLLLVAVAHCVKRSQSEKHSRSGTVRKFGWFASMHCVHAYICIHGNIEATCRIKQSTAHVT